MIINVIIINSSNSSSRSIIIIIIVVFGITSVKRDYCFSKRRLDPDPGILKIIVSFALVTEVTIIIIIMFTDVTGIL